jgi:hypothetical protein
MADDFSIRITGVERLLRKARDPQLVGGPVRRFFERAGALTAGNVRERTPVDTGRLRNSITHEVDRGQVPQFARVGTNVVYARAVEFGSRPHFPPLAALQPWAQRHGFPAGRAGSFLVARAIARRGTQPREMFKRGLSASLGGIRGFVRDLARDVEREWGQP